MELARLASAPDAAVTARLPVSARELRVRPPPEAVGILGAVARPCFFVGWTVGPCLYHLHVAVVLCTFFPVWRGWFTEEVLIAGASCGGCRTVGSAFGRRN